MIQIDLGKTKFTFLTESKTISISEKEVKFATRYEVLNPKTNTIKIFELTHSTGPEFDPNTKWIYKSDDYLTLEVCNDAQMTAIAAQNYLAAKTRKY